MEAELTAAMESRVAGQMGHCCNLQSEHVPVHAIASGCEAEQEHSAATSEGEALEARVSAAKEAATRGPSIGVSECTVPDNFLDLADVHAIGRVAFSCVVDDDPIIVAQCYIWLECMLRLQTIRPTNLFIHTPVGCDSELLRRASQLGVNVVPIAPFDRRSPHCNKISQLATFERSGLERLVLMDCDTVWVGPMELPRAAQSPAIWAKVVDHANPPEQVLAALFRAARLGEPDWVEVSCRIDGQFRRTDRNNCNGGLYIMDPAVLTVLRPLWGKWARWCLDNDKILGKNVRNADQLGFALALREMGASVTHLPIEWNYPTHLPSADLPDLSPRILHYHREMTPCGLLKEIGVARPDAAIRALNGHIATSIVQGC